VLGHHRYLSAHGFVHLPPARAAGVVRRTRRNAVRHQAREAGTLQLAQPDVERRQQFSSCATTVRDWSPVA